MIKPNTEFELCVTQMMTSEELQILTLLYQPIIGSVAVSLYMTLNTLASKSSPSLFSHHLLLQVLNVGVEDLLALRYKLEAVGLIHAVKSYEIAAVDAAVKGDKKKALIALVNNPLIPSISIAEKLLDELLDINKEFLPQFFK